MNQHAASEQSQFATAALRDARIDWAQGRIIGFSIPGGGSEAFDVVQVLLDGHCVTSAVANISVFDLSRDLAGLTLPAREQSGFELQIPSRCLHAGLVRDSAIHLEVKTAGGDPIFDTYLVGLHDLLRLTDSPPVDLLYEVRFRGLVSGSLYGTIIDKHRTGLRPVLQSRINDHPAEPLAIYESSVDGSVHHFSVLLRADRLVEGANAVRVISTDGEPLAFYPISFGVPDVGETERRVCALEAEMAFLKRLVLSQNLEALPARLSLLKGEVVSICSEMLTLQRVSFEKETAALVAIAQANRPNTDIPVASTDPADAVPVGPRGRSANAASSRHDG